MARKRTVRWPLTIVAAGGVILSLAFVNLHGRIDPRPGTLQQQRWIHGWPMTWLYRTWHPYIFTGPELGVYDPCWPWFALPKEQRDFVTTGMVGDALVAAVILFGVIVGLDIRRAAFSLESSVRGAIIFCVLVLALWLLATLVPALVVFLANACVWSAVGFAGYAFVARTRRWVRRLRKAK